MSSQPIQPSSQTTPHANGGNGRELRDKVIRLETTLEFYVSKEELEKLRTEIEKLNNSFLKWIIGTAITGIGLGVLIGRFLIYLWPVGSS